MTEYSPDQVAAAYEATRLRMAALAAGLSHDQEMLVVPTCPEWSVRDLISHNVGLATDLSQGRRGSGDTQQWVDDMVDARSDTSVVDQLDEWNESGPAFAQLIRDHPRMGFLLLDIVAHEHDLAQAIGAEGDRNSQALQIVMDTTEGQLMAADLEANGLGAVQLIDADGGRQWTYGQGDIGFTLRGSMFELFRLTGSRRSLAQLRASDHDGDLDTYLPGLLHMPAPEADIIE